MGKYYRSSVVVRWLVHSLSDCAMRLMPFGLSDVEDGSLRWKAANWLMRKTSDWAVALKKV
jgi:hypothetical protein